MKPLSGAVTVHRGKEMCSMILEYLLAETVRGDRLTQNSLIISNNLLYLCNDDTICRVLLIRFRSKGGGG